MGFFVGFAAVALFGPTVHKFKELMNLTPVMVGVLVAIPALTGSLLRIPFAAWADVEGGRKPFLTLLWLAVLGMVGLTLVTRIFYPANLSPSLYWLLLLLGLLSGCGIATFSVGITQVSYWYPQKLQGSALGFYAGYGNVAPGLFSFLLPFSLEFFGLSLSYLLWLVLLVAGSLLYLFAARNAWFFQLRASGASYEEASTKAKQQGQEIIPTGNLRSALEISAKVWKTWALVIIYFTSFGGFIGLTAWFPTYWTSFFSTTATLAGLLTAIYSVLTSVIRVLGGKISDRIGGGRTALISLGIMLVGSIFVSLSTNFSFSVFAVVLMAVGMGVTNSAVFKLVPQEIPKAVGGAAGWVGGLGALGGFVIPPILGAFVRAMGSSGYSFGFIVFAFLAIMSLALSFALVRVAKVKKEAPVLANGA